MEQIPQLLKRLPSAPCPSTGERVRRRIDLTHIINDWPANLPTMAKIYDLDIQVKWAVEKMIPKQAITLLHGRGGCGKTWVGLQLGGCVADGQPFAGLKVNKEPCYYVDFENPLAVLHDRALILGKSNLKIWHSSHKDSPPKLDAEAWEKYKALPVGVLIVDTLRAAQIGDENSSKEMAIILVRLKELRDIGFTIILLHHTPKGNEKIYKGSTAILDLCDHVLSLEQVKEAGSSKVVEDNDSLDHPLRLGTRQKTRFLPCKIFLQFDPERGFERAIGPDEGLSEEILKILFGSDKQLNQAELYESAKKKLAISRNRFHRIMKDGENIFWVMKIEKPPTGGKRVFYEPIRPA
jgi:hypothetical protein